LMSAPPGVETDERGSVKHAVPKEQGLDRFSANRVGGVGEEGRK
jgi:hypothetical protein